MPESSAADTTMTRSTCLGDPSSEAGATIDRPQCPASERTRYWDPKAGRFRRHRLAHARSAWPIPQDHNSFRACLHLPADRSNQHPQSAPLGPIPWMQEGDRQPRMVPSAAPGANELPGTAGPSGNLLASQVSLISFGATGTTWPRPVMKAATSPRAISSASMHQPLRIPTQDAHAGAEKRGGGRRHGSGLDTGRLCRRAKRTFFITGRTTGPLRCRALVRPCGSRPFARDPPGTWSPALLGPPARRGGRAGRAAPRRMTTELPRDWGCRLRSALRSRCPTLLRNGFGCLHPQSRGSPPVCEEVTISQVESLSDPLSQVRRGDDIAGGPVGECRNPVDKRQGHRQHPDPPDHGKSGGQMRHHPARVACLVDDPMVNAERLPDHSVDFDPAFRRADLEGCRMPAVRHLPVRELLVLPVLLHARVHIDSRGYRVWQFRSKISSILCRFEPGLAVQGRHR